MWAHIRGGQRASLKVSFPTDSAFVST